MKKRKRLFKKKGGDNPNEKRYYPGSKQYNTYSTQTRFSDSIARTPEQYRNGLMMNKDTFKFKQGGTKHMTMNTPMGTVPYPIEYKGYTDNVLTDQGVAYPGEDFTVEGDTVKEKPLSKFKGIFQRGGTVEESQGLPQAEFIDEEELDPNVDPALENDEVEATEDPDDVNEIGAEDAQMEETTETTDLTNNPDTGNPMSFTEAYRYAQDNNLEVFMWKGKEYKNNKYKA